MTDQTLGLPDELERLWRALRDANAATRDHLGGLVMQAAADSTARDAALSARIDTLNREAITTRAAVDDLVDRLRDTAVTADLGVACAQAATKVAVGATADSALLKAMVEGWARGACGSKVPQWCAIAASVAIAIASAVAAIAGGGAVAPPVAAGR